MSFIGVGLAASLVSAPLAMSDATDVTPPVEDIVIPSMDDPEGVALWVTVPEDARVGERMTLVITIRNARKEAPFYLEDIDIAGGYLKGFTVRDVQPRPVDSYEIEGDITLEYNARIPAQTSQRFSVVLQPIASGAFMGDVAASRGALRKKKRADSAPHVLKRWSSESNARSSQRWKSGMMSSSVRSKSNLGLNPINLRILVVSGVRRSMSSNPSPYAVW